MPEASTRETRERFASLLGRFSAIAEHHRSSHPETVVRFRGFLDQFRERRQRSDSLDRTQAATHQARISSLLTRYNTILDRHYRQQERVADDFNLLEVLRLTSSEIRHSMVLAWLLDRNPRKLGTHAQGQLGFRLFLSELALPSDYADCNYWVRREVVGDESIVDIEIACRGHFLIHIENKIWSDEGIDQTDREWSDLGRRANDLAVNGTNVHALFLTPHGTAPGSRNFRAISWGRIVHVLETFSEHAKPPDVKLFAAHYARALQRFIVEL